MLLLVLALLAGAQASPSALKPIRLYLGALPDSDGAVAPVTKEFKASYADLRRVHGRIAGLYRDTRSVPPLTLVDDATQADLVLTVTHRGPLAGQGKSVATLIARLTVRRAGDTLDLAGIAPGRTGRVRWTEQAESIYKQTVAFADTSYAALVRLRAVR